MEWKNGWPRNWGEMDDEHRDMVQNMRKPGQSFWGMISSCALHCAPTPAQERLYTHLFLLLVVVLVGGKKIPAKALYEMLVLVFSIATAVVNKRRAAK